MLGRLGKNKKESKPIFLVSVVSIFVVLFGGILFFVMDGSSSKTIKTQQATQSHERETTQQIAKDTKETAASSVNPSATVTQRDDKIKTSSTLIGKEQQKVNKSGYIEGQKLPSQPTVVSGIVIVNKKHPLPASYAPGVQPEADKALKEMIATAKVNGFQLTAFSSYRSYDRQKQLYNNYVKKDGQQAADRYSARPGYSEHQTGLAFDIGEIGREEVWLSEAFGETKAGQWLFTHAQEYGFILRYPKNKENITGYMYESWHYRYVGKKLAKQIYKQHVTLEEYLKMK